MDVCLPNVCFDANYCPVLIDLTNCLHLDTSAGPPPISGSMYKRPRMDGDNSTYDYMQLGLMLLFVLDENINDHTMVPKDSMLYNNSFLSQLIGNCEYREDLLPSSVVKGGSTPIAELLDN